MWRTCSISKSTGRAPGNACISSKPTTIWWQYLRAARHDSMAMVCVVSCARLARKRMAEEKAAVGASFSMLTAAIVVLLASSRAEARMAATAGSLAATPLACRVDELDTGRRVAA